MKVALPKGISKKVTNSQDAFNAIHPVLMRQAKIRRKSEYYWVIGLDVSRDILFIELIAIGVLNKVASDPVEVFCIAVRRKCKNLILVHNHTGRNKKPSEQDIRHTKKLREGGRLLGIDILDHLIITEGSGYYSFADEGLL
ncbi:MAG: JAB domain-containing protein [Bacteroidia bacterium]